MMHVDMHAWVYDNFTKLTFFAAALNASLWLISGLLDFILCISSLSCQEVVYIRSDVKKTQN